LRDEDVGLLDVGDGDVGRLRAVELPLEGGVRECRGRSTAGFVPRVDEGGVEEVVGVYEAHEAVVDFGEFIIVQGGGEFGRFGEGEGFMAEDGEGPMDISKLKGVGSRRLYTFR